jgi:hypothetical protein
MPACPEGKSFRWRQFATGVLLKYLTQIPSIDPNPQLNNKAVQQSTKVTDQENV